MQKLSTSAGKADWNQKPRRYTVDVPEPLALLIEARKSALLYPSISKYIFWTLVYELTLRKPHRYTPWLMRQTEAKQHEVFEDLIANFDSPKTPGSWFEARVKEEALALIESGAVDEEVLKRAQVLGKDINQLDLPI